METQDLTGKTPAEAQSATEQVENTTPTAEGEAFDKVRAMETITKLREIEKQYKKEQKEFERLKADEAKRKEAEMSEAEKLKARADQLEAELKSERSARLKLKVAAKYQLPDALAARLQGDTEEELEADAKGLAELLPKQSEPKKAPQLKANDISDGVKGETDAQKRARIYGAGGNLYDLEAIKAKGGGSIVNLREK